MTIAFRHDPQTTNLPIPELAFRTVAAFRAHPHVNNVLTHIFRGDWAAVEQSLQRIFNPATSGAGLSVLEQNLVDLMHAERGITGHVLKPYFRERLGKLLETEQVEEVLAHVEALFVQSQATTDPGPSGIESAVRTSFDLAAN